MDGIHAVPTPVLGRLDFIVKDNRFSAVAGDGMARRWGWVTVVSRCLT